MPRFARLVAAVVVLAPAAAWTAWAAPARSPKTPPRPIVTAVDSLRRFDANLLDMIVTNTGSLGFDTGAGNSGLVYPRGSGKTVLFASGLWVGARVGGQTRVTVSEYLSEWQPGRIVGGVAEPFDGPELRNWKVRPVPAYRQASDTLFVAGVSPADAVAHESWADYRTIAAPRGAPTAPFVTVIVDDGLAGATIGPYLPGDLALWSVFNDANPARHRSDAGGTAPLGLEVHQTVFGFDTTPASTVFVRWTLHHRGSAPLDSVVVTFWVDPDLGGAGDDLVGWDAARQMGYVYNATNTDNVYGSDPPALGIRYLSGTTGTAAGAFNKYIGGTDPASPVETDRLMRGLQMNGDPWIDPLTQLPTRFPFYGDPVTGAAWLDSLPADRRFLVSTPPFDLAPGDSATFLFAVVVGQGYERIDSIDRLRCQADRFDASFTGFGVRLFPSDLRLVHSESSVARVYLEWTVGGANPYTLHLRRHRGSTSLEWPETSELVAALTEGGSGLLTYEDEALPERETWTYGLIDPCDPFHARATVTLVGPNRAPIFLAASPVTSGPVVLFVNLPTADPVRLEAFAVNGRRMLDRSFANGALGPSTVPVAGTEGWPAGVYVFRLTQADLSMTTRVVVVR